MPSPSPVPVAVPRMISSDLFCGVTVMLSAVIFPAVGSTFSSFVTMVSE